MDKELKPLFKCFDEMLEIMLGDEVVCATKYLSSKLIIRATRRRYKGKISNKRPFEVMLTMGKPNYREREFIRKCKKAKEPFPVKKIQLKYAK